MKWLKIKKPVTGSKYLVTNNLKARDTLGNMSHLWLVDAIYKADDGELVAFTDSTKLRNLTHFIEINP